MAGRYLLDTNIVVAALNRDVAVIDQLDRAPRVYVSVVVLGEIYYGAQKSKHARANLARAEQLLKGARLLIADKITARHYGRIKADLESIGRRIPDNDIWIAAAAMQHDLRLISRDQHFRSITGLRLEAW